MIRFFDVTKMRFDAGVKKTRYETLVAATKVDGASLSDAIILKNCTTVLDGSTFSNVAHEDVDVASTFLQLVYGSVKPDRGRLVNEGDRISPVIALGGRSDLLIPTLTVRENIQFQARLSHIDSGLIARQIFPMYDLFRETLRAAGHRIELPSAGALLDSPLNSVAFPLRRLIELGIFTTIPYDCYLVDRLELLPEFAQAYLFEIAWHRGAGVFFATSRAPVAARFRDSTIAIVNGQLEFYN